MEIDIQAGFHLGTSIDEGIKEVGGLLTKGLNRLPYRKTLTQTAIGDDTNILTLDFGAPPTGSMWEIDQVVSFGNDAFENVPDVRAALFYGNSGNPSLSGLFLPGMPFPGFWEFQTGKWIESQQNVFAITNIAVPAGQQIGINLYFNEWLMNDSSKTTGRPQR